MLYYQIVHHLLLGEEALGKIMPHLRGLGCGIPLSRLVRMSQQTTLHWADL